MNADVSNTTLVTAITPSSVPRPATGERREREKHSVERDAGRPRFHRHDRLPRRAQNSHAEHATNAAGPTRNSRRPSIANPGMTSSPIAPSVTTSSAPPQRGHAATDPSAVRWGYDRTTFAMMPSSVPHRVRAVLVLEQFVNRVGELVQRMRGLDRDGQKRERRERQPNQCVLHHGYRLTGPLR